MIKVIVCALALVVSSVASAQSVDSAPTNDVNTYICAHTVGQKLGNCQVHLTGIGDLLMRMRKDVLDDGIHFIGYFEHECKLMRLEIVTVGDEFKLSTKEDNTCKE